MPRSIAGARRWLTALALLLLFPRSAEAHTSLRRSEPAKGARLTAAPTRIRLWFTARPQLAFSRLTLRGPGGAVSLGPLAADSGDAFHADIIGTLPPGEYTVQWQTASADGHAARGDFRFLVLARADSTMASVPPPVIRERDSMNAAEHAHTAPESAHEEHGEYHTARWVEFVALLTVLGVLGFRHGVLPPLAVRGVPTSDAGERARRLGMNVLVLYVAAALARAYNESVAVHGDALALRKDLVVPMLTTTVWGMGWLFGVVGAVLLAFGWILSRRRVALGTPLALSGALGMIFSPALSGHAAASTHFVLSVMLDVLHVAAAGLWIGGLLMVLIAGIPAMRRLENGNPQAAVSALVNSFHPLALFCAPLVIVAGVGTAWLRLATLPALWQTEYGMTLIRKTVLVAFVLAMGAFNAYRARRRLTEAAGTKRLLVTGGIELAFAAIVLALTTILVTQPVPTELPVP